MEATRFNTVNRGGNPFITTDSTLQTAATIQAKANTLYEIVARVRAFRVQAGYLNQVASYWRRAVFYSNGSKVLTQVGATQTIGTDIETLAGWQCEIRPNPADNTQIAVQVAADGTPTNWVVDIEPTVCVVDQIAQA